jgi:hypothetical protein
MLGDVPKDAITFAAGRFDLGALIQEAEQALKTIDPSGELFSGYQQAYQEIENRLGFSLKKDFIASLGSENYSFSFMPPLGGLIPYTVGVVSLQNPALANKWIRQLAKLVGFEIKKIKYFNKDIMYLSLPLGKLGSNPFEKLERIRNPIEGIFASIAYGLSGTSFFIDGKKLYYANSMQEIKAFLNLRGEGKCGLSDSPDFQKAAAYLPQNSSLVFYDDWRPIIAGLWNTGTPLLRAFEGFIRDAGIPFDSALLPQAQSITGHIIPGLTTYISDEDGVLLQSYSTCGGGMMLVPIVGITAAIAIPGLLRARISANESVAIGTLRSLCTSQAQFQSQMEVDQDQDGTGEYAFIQKLCGAIPPRGKQNPVNPTYTMPSLDGSMNNGVAIKSGYCFYCYLPGKGKAMGEDSIETLSSANEADQPAINSQENCYIIYAWPVEPNTTGMRAFAINQGGEVVACSGHYYSRWNKPNPEDAFSQSATNAANLEGNLGYGEVGHNGCYWVPAGY